MACPNSKSCFNIYIYFYYLPFSVSSSLMPIMAASCILIPKLIMLFLHYLPLYDQLSQPGLLIFCNSNYNCNNYSWPKAIRSFYISSTFMLSFVQLLYFLLNAESNKFNSIWNKKETKYDWTPLHLVWKVMANIIWRMIFTWDFVLFATDVEHRHLPAVQSRGSQVRAERPQTSGQRCGGHRHVHQVSPSSNWQHLVQWNLVITRSLGPWKLPSYQGPIA